MLIKFGTGQAWCILHNDNKEFMTSLLLRNCDAITCVLADAQA